MKEIKFKGHSDELLSARLDVPSGKINEIIPNRHKFFDEMNWNVYPM